MNAKDYRRIALNMEGAEEGSQFGAVDFRVGGRIFATLAAVFSLCGLQFWSRFRRHAMVPVGNLRLEQSLHFENA